MRQEESGPVKGQKIDEAVSARDNGNDLSSFKEDQKEVREIKDEKLDEVTTLKIAIRF